MARSTSRFNRLLEIIGLVDDEPDEEKASRKVESRRVTPEDAARTRYGSQAPYSRSASAARTSYGSQAYGSAGRAATYERGSYGQSAYDRTAAQRAGYERGGYQPESARREPYRREPDDELEFEAQPARKPAQERPARQPMSPAKRDNVVPFSRDSRHHMIVYYLHTLDECRDVIKDLLDNKSVLLNLEDMDERVLQRAIDTLGGAAFALNATLRKASDRTYLIAPTNVDIAYTNDADRPY